MVELRFNVWFLDLFLGFFWVYKGRVCGILEVFGNIINIMIILILYLLC